jgi:hypothetical protein
MCKAVATLGLGQGVLATPSKPAMRRSRRRDGALDTSGMVFLAVSAAIESTECRRVTRYTDLETDYDRQRARKRHAENTW